MLSSARKQAPQAQPRPRRRSRRPDPTFSVHDAETLQTLTHPIRVQILEALREPASAATVARRIGLPRQKVNYHLKELERAGLVELIEERRVGNFVESVYRAVARTFLVSPRVAWADPRRMEALRSQHSLETLVLLGERLQRDAAGLLDRAAFDGEQIASASVIAEARFEDEADREAFLQEYLRTTAELLDRYGAKEGEPYRIALAAYPGDPAGEA
jgi:DNA-binding transcriptional ArsR family regulator